MSATDNFIGRPQAVELSPTELAFMERPEAPESIRERVAAEIAHEDAQALREPPGDAAEWWLFVREMRPQSARYYRRCADRAIRVLTESALR